MMLVLGRVKMKILDMPGRVFSHQHQMLRRAWAWKRIISAEFTTAQKTMQLDQFIVPENLHPED